MSGTPGEDVEVVLAGPVDPAHAPEPRDPSERLVFGQLYETLVRIDCEGTVRPGVARSWSHDAEGRRWRFTLDEDASFWDGTPVTATAVARGWAVEGVVDAGTTAPGIRSVTAEGERELSVVLEEPSASVETFANPAVSVVGQDRYGGWPRGTGRWRPAEDTGNWEPSVGVLRLVPTGAGEPSHGLAFRVAGRGDPRAPLDAGADVLVSTAPDAIAYARELPGFTTVPLPWSRTYVLAAPGEVGRPEASPFVSAVPAEDLAALARGAVRAEARAAEPPFAWREVDPCGTRFERGGVRRARAGTAGAAETARIVYPLGDDVARELAERLVALAGRGGAMPTWLRDVVPGLEDARKPVVAAGLDPSTLARLAASAEGSGKGESARTSSSVLAFVVPVPRAPGGACASALLLGEDEVASAVLDPTAELLVTPLVDTRPSLVAREGLAGLGSDHLEVDGLGTLVFRPRGAGDGEVRR